jgi:hypothetical protein
MNENMAHTPIYEYPCHLFSVSNSLYITELFSIEIFGKKQRERVTGKGVYKERSIIEKKNN